MEFVDSDDWLEPEAVEILLTEAQKENVKAVAAGRWDVSARTGEKKKGLCPPRREVISGQEMVRRIFRWENCDSSACDKLFHRSLFQDIRFPLGVACEDLPIMYRILLDAGQVAMVDKPIYFYFHRSGSITYTAVSQKDFHFSRHTAQILPYIAANCPALLPEARYLRVRSLVYAVQSVDLASKEDRETFREPCRECRKALRRELSFVWKSPFFTQKERITDCLLGLNLYRLARPLFSRAR